MPNKENPCRPELEQMDNCPEELLQSGQQWQKEAGGGSRPTLPHGLTHPQPAMEVATVKLEPTIGTGLL